MLSFLIAVNEVTLPVKIPALTNFGVRAESDMLQERISPFSSPENTAVSV